MNKPEKPADIEADAAPAGLAEAILSVMRQVHRLDKASKNEHGKYDFTSVDDFKDFVRPLMVEAGLVLHVTQTAFQMVQYVDGKGDRAVAQFDFKITLEHAPTKEKGEPEDVTVALPMTGAQTSGAAKSYVIKEWMKAKFLISSGDSQDEADLIEQSREGLRLPKKDARPLYEQLQKEMTEVAEKRDHEALAQWWLSSKERSETLPKDWFLTLRQEYADAYKSLKANEELDRMTNDELDERAMRDELARHPINAG